MFNTFTESDIVSFASKERERFHAKSKETFLPLDNLKKHSGRIFIPESRLLKDFPSMRSARRSINEYAEKVLKTNCKVTKSKCEYTGVAGFWVEIK